MLVVKVQEKRSGTTRRFRTERLDSFSNLSKTILSLFELPPTTRFTLSYLDQDNDVITFSTDHELAALPSDSLSLILTVLETPPISGPEPTENVTEHEHEYENQPEEELEGEGEGEEEGEGEGQERREEENPQPFRQFNFGQQQNIPFPAAFPGDLENMVNQMVTPFLNMLGQAQFNYQFGAPQNPTPPPPAPVAPSPARPGNGFRSFDGPNGRTYTASYSFDGNFQLDRALKVVALALMVYYLLSSIFSASSVSSSSSSSAPVLGTALAWTLAWYIFVVIFLISAILSLIVSAVLTYFVYRAYQNHQQQQQQQYHQQSRQSQQPRQRTSSGPSSPPSSPPSPSSTPFQQPQGEGLRNRF